MGLSALEKILTSQAATIIVLGVGIVWLARRYLEQVRRNIEQVRRNIELSDRIIKIFELRAEKSEKNNPENNS